jgi:hypothetical protein
MASAMTRANTMPSLPPRACPANINSAVSAAININVFNVLTMKINLLTILMLYNMARLFSNYKVAEWLVKKSGIPLTTGQKRMDLMK